MDSFTILTNPPFVLNWDGKDYEVRKAGLDKVALFQNRSGEYVRNNVSGSDPLLGAYAIWLILHDQIPELTEDDILKKVSGDTDLRELFYNLGFITPARFQEALKMLPRNQSTTPDSGATLPTEPDGLPEKSAS